MALAIDATATASTHTAGATSLTNTLLTVGAGATSLLAAISFQEFNFIPGSVSLRWDSAGTNQLMTQIVEIQSSVNNNNWTQLWGLVNPTTGNKTLNATWTNSVPTVLDAISFSGGVTTSVATAFVRSGTNNGTSGAPTLSLTGASGNISVCVTGTPVANVTALTATSSSLWFTDSTEPNLFVRGATAPSATTVSWSATPTSTEWGIAGVDVVAATGNTFTGERTIDAAGGIVGATIQRMLGSTLRW